MTPAAKYIGGVGINDGEVVVDDGLLLLHCFAHAILLAPPPPRTTRRFAVGASNVCLVGKTPTCSVPAL